MENLLLLLLFFFYKENNIAIQGTTVKLLNAKFSVKKKNPKMTDIDLL